MPTNKVYKDQMGREVDIPIKPRRIVSLVPSQTELLFNLGLKQQLVGITKYCTHPADGVNKILKVGGTKQLDIELIKTLNPDLIIVNKEENERTQVEELCRRFPVWISDIAGLNDAIAMIKDLGWITGRSVEADKIAGKITSSFIRIKPLQTNIKVAYLIWRKPYMLAGNGTFINDMLTRCGLQNAVEEARYPQKSIDQLIEINPDVLFLSSEPYPFKEKHIHELKAYLPNAKMYLVDGELFSWYGSRLQFSSAYFQQLINKIESGNE